MEMTTDEDNTYTDRNLHDEYKYLALFNVGHFTLCCSWQSPEDGR